MRAALAGLLLALLAGPAAGLAQAGDDVGQALSWQWRIEPVDARAGDTAELVFAVDLAADWILYSSDFVAPIGPQPVRFSFDPTAGIELLGAVDSVRPRRRTDPSWGFEYGYFAGRGEFRQRVRLLRGGTRVQGTIRGQACYEKDGSCHLFRQAFAIDAP
jgi:thiol:disulfide interchange protein DsbD